VNREGSHFLPIEQAEKFSERGPVTDGIESASEKSAEIRPRHPLRNRDRLPFNEKVEKGNTAIFHLPADGAYPPEKRVQRVFDLDCALVAGIINYALASVATTVNCRLVAK
jgi:hypothetical protein